MAKSPEKSKSEAAQRVEQRREPRQVAGGEVRLTFPDAQTTSGVREVRGRLLDRSASGLRTEHGFAGLTCGQIVQYHCESSRGQARVVWTRISGDRVESGLFILP
jgi:hypothetical protein